MPAFLLLDHPPVKYLPHPIAPPARRSPRLRAPPLCLASAAAAPLAAPSLHPLLSTAPQGMAVPLDRWLHGFGASTQLRLGVLTAPQHAVGMSGLTLAVAAACPRVSLLAKSSTRTAACWFIMVCCCSPDSHVPGERQNSSFPFVASLWFFSSAVFFFPHQLKCRTMAVFLHSASLQVVPGALLLSSTNFKLGCCLCIMY
jgi:hypothetical protein